MFLTPTCLPLPPTYLPACLPQAELFCSWSSAIVTSNTILHKVDTRIRIWLLGQSSPRIVNGTISTNNVCTEEGQHNAQSTCASSPSSILLRSISRLRLCTPLKRNITAVALKRDVCAYRCFSTSPSFCYGPFVGYSKEGICGHQHLRRLHLKLSVYYNSSVHEIINSFIH